MKHAITFCLLLIMATACNALAQRSDATVHISCYGRDQIDTVLSLTRFTDPATKGTHLLGFLSTAGKAGRLRYDIAIELKSTPKKRDALCIRDISAFITDQEDNLRAAFLNGPGVLACLPILPTSGLSLGLLAPQLGLGQYQNDTCIFTEFFSAPTKR